jgi:hypothetical protein
MKKSLILFCFLSVCFLLAQEKPITPEVKKEQPKEEKPLTATVPIISNQIKEQRSVMVVSPKERALDYIKAFELLKLEKPSAKIYFQLFSNKVINNIIDLSILDNGTLVLFKIATTQGTKLLIVPIEDIQEISHL